MNIDKINKEGNMTWDGIIMRLCDVLSRIIFGFAVVTILFCEALWISLM